ncbi:Ethr [Cordylochernes scorpioides]|uniref:Ethr n=1 Tax=Cordylochernes scorpioides TaxID=51811 RepID=A0ABY6KV03_9ARAC|nr:Ethr [Cordylochernes scorpioides]
MIIVVFVCAGKLVPYVELSVAHSSVLTILALSLERYWAISWVVALAAAAPIVPLTELRSVPHIDGQPATVCETSARRPLHKAYHLGVAAALFWAPLALVAGLYGAVARRLAATSSAPCPPAERRRRRATWGLAAVVASGLACLLPFRVFTAWLILAPPSGPQDLGRTAFYHLLYLCRLLVYLHSALNPLLYNAVSSKFRAAFVRVLLCRRPSPRARLLRHETASSTLRPPPT